MWFWHQRDAGGCDVMLPESHRPTGLDDVTMVVRHRRQPRPVLLGACRDYHLPWVDWCHDLISIAQLATLFQRHGVANHQQIDSVFAPYFVREVKKETSKFCITVTDPLWGESAGDRWIPITKGQQWGNCFHVMTSERKEIIRGETLTHWGRDNWSPFFNMHFLERKILYFDSNFPRLYDESPLFQVIALHRT